MRFGGCFGWEINLMGCLTLSEGMRYLLFLLVSLPVFADVTGVVVGVADGDTVTVLDAAKTRHKVRVAGIDAPEKAQPFGQRAKQRMSVLVFGKVVRLEGHKQDRYGRTVAKVWVSPPDCQRCPQTLDAGLAVLTSGLAWHYKKYQNEQSPEDRERYAFSEDEARSKHAGLWAEANPAPPWEWRKSRRSGGEQNSNR